MWKSPAERAQPDFDAAIAGFWVLPTPFLIGAQPDFGAAPAGFWVGKSGFSDRPQPDLGVEIALFIWPSEILVLQPPDFGHIKKRFPHPKSGDCSTKIWPGPVKKAIATPKSGLALSEKPDFHSSIRRPQHQNLAWPSQHPNLARDGRMELFHGSEHLASKRFKVTGSLECLTRSSVTNPGKTRTHNPDDIPVFFFFFFFFFF